MISYTNFIAEGWRREKGNRGLVNKTLEAKEIELHMDEDFVSTKIIHLTYQSVKF